MWMPGRFIAVAMALFVIWTLVRAWRSGAIRDGVWTFYADDNPVLYTLAFASHMLIVAMFVAVAAGYTPAEFFDMVGLGWINTICPSCRHA